MYEYYAIWIAEETWAEECTAMGRNGWSIVAEFPHDEFHQTPSGYHKRVAGFIVHFQRVVEEPLSADKSEVEPVHAGSMPLFESLEHKDLDADAQRD